MTSARDIVQMAHDSVEAGGAGLSMGRNIFQAENPTRLVRALNAVVHEDYDVEQAMELLSGPDKSKTITI
jgi:class I fructose-bisphosphate aldolase